MDIFSGKTREPSSLARVTFGEQAIQLRLEAGFIVTLPFHKDVHFWRALEQPGETIWVEVREETKNMVGNEKYSNIN